MLDPPFEYRPTLLLQGRAQIEGIEDAPAHSPLLGGEGGHEGHCGCSLGQGVCLN